MDGNKKTPTRLAVEMTDGELAKVRLLAAQNGMLIKAYIRHLIAEQKLKPMDEDGNIQE